MLSKPVVLVPGEGRPPFPEVGRVAPLCTAVTRSGNLTGVTGPATLTSTAVGHADRPDQVERKTTEYPPRETGVKAGPEAGSVCRQSAAEPG